MGKTSPKRCSSHCLDSVGSAAGYLHGFVSLGVIRHGVIDSSWVEEVCSQSGFATLYCLFASV